MDILNRIAETIKTYKLIDYADRILIGVSGGPDSLMLLTALVHFKNEFGLYLHIAHLDHKMRKNSQRDRIFVQKLAKKLNIDVTTSETVLLKEKNKGSLEEKARQIRYDFLLKTAKDNNCKKIALGHTEDDQAETVLMRIIRGTGLYGLQAIQSKRIINNYILIRPLIEIDRVSIEDFLKKKRIKFMEDKTNEDLYFLRNRIRHKLLPLLQKEYNPNIKHILSAMASHSSVDYAYLEDISKKTLTRCVIKNKKPANEIYINLKKFKKLNLSLRRMSLRYALNTIKGNLRRLTFKHIQEIESLFTDRPFGSIVNLPQGITVTKKEDRLVIH